MDFIEPDKKEELEQLVDVSDGSDYGVEEDETKEELIKSPISWGTRLISFIGKCLKISSSSNHHHNTIKDSIEQKIALKFEGYEWYQILHRLNFALLLGQLMLTLIVIIDAFGVNLFSQLLRLFLSFFITMIGTITKKYEIDITSVLNQEFDELEKMKMQKLAINQLFMLIAIGNFVFITSMLQAFIQSTIDRIFRINEMLNSSGDASVSLKVAHTLWGSPTISHFVYLVPGITIAFFTYYGRNYEVFLKWSEFYTRWSKEKWFDNPNFIEMFLGKREDYEPYLFLGIDQETGAQIWLDPIARMNNFLAQGPVGVGKSQAIFRPFIYQDIKYFLRYVREFVKYRKKYKDDKKFETKFFNRRRAGKMLNGFMVIEPSNDLVSAIYKDLLKIGFPKEMITYVNPSDPETPGINVFAGPVDKVVSMVTKILGDLSKSANTFFDNTQRTYLKKMTYLLKLSFMIPNKLDKNLVGSAPTFQAFNQLKYNEVLWERKIILGEYIQVLEKKKSEFTKLDLLTANYRDFMYKYWITKDVYDYWDKNLHEKDGVVSNDKEEHVQGLLTVIDDIASNIYISRVFFQDTEFNFDVLLKYGGILLVNTDVRDLGGDVGTFAKFISLAAEQASFRRTPYAYPMFPYYDDEHPEYVTDNTPVFTSQSRKYQTPGHYACQSKSQYHSKDNPKFADTFFTNLRNRAVFQGVLPDDAEWYEKLFGSKHVIKATYTESEFDYHSQNAKQSKVPERPEIEPNISKNDLESLPQFTLAMGTTNKKGEVIQFTKVKALPAFKMTDSLPKANVGELKLWFSEYKHQLEFYNKNSSDLFSLGENVASIIKEIKKENELEERENAPANIFARVHVKKDIEESKQRIKDRSNLNSESIQQEEVDDEIQQERNERLSIASLLLNAEQQTD